MIAEIVAESGWNPHQRKIVAQVLGDCQWLVSHQALLSYRSYRPWAGPARWPRPTHPWANDCTGTIKQVVCDWNGIPTFDGTGVHYGDTETFANSPDVYRVPSLEHAQPLDICLYNHGGPFVGGPHEHAAMLTHQHAGTWYAFSMGKDSDPSYIVAANAGSYGPPRLIIRFRIPLK